jgi:hypothetical protein
MLFTEDTMPDGQKRIYCLRIASVTAYFCDDEEGGNVAIVEPGDYITVPQETLDQVRTCVLEAAAQRLNCPVDAVEKHGFDSLQKLLDLPDPPRHPWQAKTRGKKKPFGR